MYGRMNLRISEGNRQRVTRFAKFGIVGCINTAIDFGLFLFLFYSLDVPLLWANTASYLIALLNSYLMNKRWTFADTSTGIDAVVGFGRFAAVNLVGLVIANVGIWAGSFLLPVPVAKALSIGFTMLWNYWSSSRFAFRNARL